MVSAQLSYGCRRKVFLTITKRESCTRAITADIYVFGRIRQAVSDNCSARKRQCRVMLFSALRYRRFQLRFVEHACVTHAEEEKATQVGEVLLAKARLLHYFDNAT